MFIILNILISSNECKIYSKNCEQCLGLGKNYSCGWCKETNECMIGTLDGPINKTCTIWTYKFNMQCHLDSAETLPNNTRIIIAIFSTLVALFTAIFWICIYPQCTNTKKNEEKSQLAENSE